MSLNRFLLLASAAMVFSVGNIQGRKEDEWETRHRIRNFKLTKSKKTPLTPKQQKARDKSKRASKDRNKLRRHKNYPIQLKNERASRSIKL